MREIKLFSKDFFLTNTVASHACVCFGYLLIRKICATAKACINVLKLIRDAILKSTLME